MSKQIEKGSNQQIESCLPEVFKKLNLITKNLPKEEQIASELEQAIGNEAFIRRHLLPVFETFFDKYPSKKLYIVKGKNGDFKEGKPTINSIFICKEENEDKCDLMYDSGKTAIGLQRLSPDFLKDLYIDSDLVITFMTDAPTVDAFGSLSRKQIVDRLKTSISETV